MLPGRTPSDDKRRAILEAERQAADLGIEHTGEQRRDIIAKLDTRFANVGWGWTKDNVVLRTDETGTPRVIPIEEAVGYIAGLPAHPDSGKGSKDFTSRHGRTKPYEEKVAFDDPGKITPRSPAAAAEAFYGRIRGAIEQYGTIPQVLLQDLHAEGWRQGAPIPWDKVRSWAGEYTKVVNQKYGR